MLASTAHAQMSRSRETLRRCAARVLLGIAAFLQFMLIMALPLSTMTKSEVLSLISLASLMIMSIGSAIGLRRRARESLIALAVASCYAVYLIIHAIANRRDILGAANSLAPGEILAFGLASFALAPLPIALLIALPLLDEPSAS
jgi:hypothetical protein